MTWVALSSNDGDIAITPPNFYAIVGQVKTTHSQADIVKLASGRGLSVFQIQEGQANGDYRQVAFQAQAVSANTLPWSAPWPLSIADSTHVTQAWVSPPADTPNIAPASNKPTSKLPLWILGGLAAVGGVAFWLLPKR